MNWKKIVVIAISLILLPIVFGNEKSKIELSGNVAGAFYHTNFLNKFLLYILEAKYEKIDMERFGLCIDGSYFHNADIGG